MQLREDPVRPAQPGWRVVSGRQSVTRGENLRRRPARLTRIEQSSTKVGSHRLAGDIDHRAVAGDEPAGQPRPAELDVPGHPLLLDDGPSRWRPRPARRR